MKRLTNAGDKIQTIAVAVAIIGTLLIVALYMFLMSEADDLISLKASLSAEAATSPFTALMKSFESVTSLIMFCMIRDILILWFWMLLLYGFGELCENVYELNHGSKVTFYDEYERFKNEKVSRQSPGVMMGVQNPSSQKDWHCPNCGRLNIGSGSFCMDCGFKR